MQKFVVTKQEAGWRFHKYLKKRLPQASSGFLYKMLRKKNITLNEKKAAGNEVIAAGDTVQLFFSEETYRKFSGELPEQLSGQKNGGISPEAEPGSGREIFSPYLEAFRRLGDISVIYEDDDILVLNKPAGVLSQKAKKDDISLNEWMIGYLLEKKEVTREGLLRFRPSVCNRLDRNTSGLVLCGKSVRGSQFLSGILRDRSLKKYYLAYVQGRIEHPATLKGYLKKEEEKNRSEILSDTEYERKVRKEPEAAKKYREVETVIEPLYYIEERNCTKLKILLVTGKSHQIRAHLAGIGHPVLGDVKYGWKPEGKGDAGFGHQLLHAFCMEFPEVEGEFAYLSGRCFGAREPELFKAGDG